jgi:hypothetical protein
VAGHHEAQVRRAMLTVGDADVLNEMADGWRSSIRDLDRVRGGLGDGVRRLREQEQLGERTRDAAVAAFREMRDHLTEQQRLLVRTARALDEAGDVIGEAMALVRAWDRQGQPQPPGPAPQPSADAVADRTAYLAEATRHHRASARYAFQVQQREDEARAAWEELNRVFTRSEDMIRSAHGIPREEQEVDPQTVWPPVDWPGAPPPDPDPHWPPLPPWPPVRDTPGPTTSTGPRGPGPATTAMPPGTSHVPVPSSIPGHGGSHPSSVGAPAASHPHAGGHGSTPSTAVAGSAQGGVAYAPGHASSAGLGAPPATSGSTGPAGLPGLSGATASASAAGVAGAAVRGGATAGAARASSSGSPARAGQGSTPAGRTSRGGRGAVGGKGSQQAAGRARSGSGAAGATSGGSGGGASPRRGRRKDSSAVRRDDLLATDEHWLDDEGTAPDVLR